jgi:hypothetical protein
MYLYSVDTSLSLNNTDYLVNEKTNIEYSIDSARVRGKVLVKLSSLGKEGKPINIPNPIYKRIFLPASAHLTSVRIDNQPIVSGTFPIGAYPDLVGWGFLMNTKVGLDSTLEIEYEQPLSTSESQIHFYIDLPNQPGAEDALVSVLVNYPRNWQASTLSHPVVATPGTLRYNTSSRDYQRIEIDFTKK